MDITSIRPKKLLEFTPTIMVIRYLELAILRERLGRDAGEFALQELRQINERDIRPETLIAL